MASHIQSVGVQSSGPVASQPVTFGAPTTSGNLIAVCVVGYNGPATFTVTDNQGNTFTSVVRNTSNPTAVIAVEIFYVKNITGGTSHEITVTPSVSAWVTVSVHEYSGLDTTAPADGATSANGTSTTPSSGNLTTTAAGVLVGAMTHDGTTMAIGPGSGWTERFEAESANNQPGASEDRIEASAGTFAADWTLGASAGWSAAIAAFKEAGGGGGGGGSLLLRLMTEELFVGSAN